MTRLILPENGTGIIMLTDTQRSFQLEKESGGTDSQIDWAHLTKAGTEDNTQPPKQTFVWETDAEESVLEISEEAGFPPEKTWMIRTSEKQAAINNFKVGQEYYWRVNDSGPFRFTTEDVVPRWIEVGGLTNVRDCGGWTTRDGRRIRQGLLYRGSEMDKHHAITEEGKRVLCEQLQIKTDLDLRGGAVGMTESPMGAQIQLEIIPIAAYQEYMREYHVECKRLFDFLCDEKNYPIYCHCWGGADRTGTFIFLLGVVLGMEGKDLILDYELTSLAIWGERSAQNESFQGFLKELRFYAGETMSEQALSYLYTCGVTEEQMQKLREWLTEK